MIKELVHILKEKGLTITTMESCTGGALISAITDIEGASSITEGGYVTYSNKAKIDIGVNSEVISKYGVYSKETAIAMSNVCRRLKKADIGVGITGSLNNVDIHNKDSQPCKVYYCITYNTSDYVFEINVPKIERKQQKEHIVNDVVMMLLEIIKGGKKDCLASI